MSAFKIIETNNPSSIILELPSGRELHVSETQRPNATRLHVISQMTDHDRVTIVDQNLNSVILELDYHVDLS